jgi:hypothetical protein
MAEGLLLQAGEILKEAQELHRRGVWNLVSGDRRKSWSWRSRLP